MSDVLLSCHSSNHGTNIQKFSVSCHRTENGILEFSYRVEGHVSAIRIPHGSLSKFTDGLWKHTCFEAFLKSADNAGPYYECNFSPSKEWAIYGFDSYRTGMTPKVDMIPSEISFFQDEHLLILETSIDLNALESAMKVNKMEIGIAAVLEESNHGHTFWSIRHPEGQPDFHHPECFSLVMEAEQLSRSVSRSHS